MSERPGEYLDAPTDRDDGTVARAVALLKAHGYFQRRFEGAIRSYDAGYPPERMAADAAARALLAQAALVELLAPSWSPERRAAVAMLTEADAAIAEIERAAREGRA